MSDYTPTTEEIRAAWLVNQSTNKAVKVGPLLDEFDRWLAEVERAAAEKALTEAADATESEAPDEPHAGATFESHAAWLRARAEAYRQERKE